ncbi:Transcriptional activator protein acu-15 [Colletotrichum fructicola]|nr:Transcriptional activator protein acu-15 [Colletotrichum fructicola]KAF5509588.1 Transcriptional activator protein acu-15 [Colletotrichum fructicola]
MSEGSGSPQARMPVACDPCRKGKRKCDRMLPCCGYCAKTGRKCGVPDVLDLQSCSRQKRQRVPKGFVEILESKVKALEQSIQKQRAELESLSTQAEYSQPMGTGPANTPAATMSMDSGLAPHVRTANDLPSASGELQDHPSCPYDVGDLRDSVRRWE